MRHDKINYLLVGVFVAGTFTALLVALLIITGKTGPTDTYFAHYENISGIKAGTPVTYEGFRIGQVDEIAPIHNDGKTRYRVALRVTKGWQVPSDSLARIVASGLLSEVNIDIQEGTGAGYLAPGDEVQAQAGPNLFAAINNLATGVEDLTENNIKPLIDNLNNRLETVSNTLEAQVPAMLAELEVLLSNLNKSTVAVQKLLGGENQTHISRALKNADETMANFHNLSVEVEKTHARLSSLLEKSNALVDENKDNIHAAIRDLRDSLENISRNIGAIVYNMDGTSRNMHEFSRQIRQNPGLLLGGTPAKDPDALQEK